jgi:uncharacterized membrane protein
MSGKPSRSRGSLPGYTSSHPQAKSSKPQEEGVVLGRHFRGPMPPPEMLANYEQIYPGFTQKLFDQQQQESTNRRKIEGDYSSGFKWTMLLSICGAILICLALIAFAILALYIGHIYVASSVICTGVVAFAAAFYKLRTNFTETKSPSN